MARNSAVSLVNMWSLSQSCLHEMARCWETLYYCLQQRPQLALLASRASSFWWGGLSCAL